MTAAAASLMTSYALQGSSGTLAERSAFARDLDRARTFLRAQPHTARDSRER
jgi:hypothetical protein